MGTIESIVVYCCDVGSVKAKAFGWARASNVDGPVDGGTEIDNLIARVRTDLDLNRTIALGFESPLFIPVPTTNEGLSCGRDGDADRSCFAPAGACVTTLGLHELLYVLGRLTPLPRFTLDWTAWRANGGAVLLWEAFVSGKAHTKTKSHCHDAATGAIAFLRAFEGEFATGVHVRGPQGVFSLAGAALLWADASRDPALLKQPTLVVKPPLPFIGEVRRSENQNANEALPLRTGANKRDLRMQSCAPEGTASHSINSARPKRRKFDG